MGFGMSDVKNMYLWRFAFELSKKIYKISEGFCNGRGYRLSDQIKRASISIVSNIAEGASRRTGKDFRSFLYNSLGSLKEVETQLMMAFDFGYFEKNVFDDVLLDIEKMGALLYGFIKKISLGIK